MGLSQTSRNHGRRQGIYATVCFCTYPVAAGIAIRISPNGAFQYRCRQGQASVSFCSAVRQVTERLAVNISARHLACARLVGT